MQLKSICAVKFIPRYFVWDIDIGRYLTQLVLRGGSAVGRWTCNIQVAGLIPGRWLLHNRSTQPCIPPGSLNRVPALAGGKGGILTSARWQVTLCDPIWHVSFP